MACVIAHATKLMTTRTKQQRLEKSLTVLADAVAHHGEVYWPLYEMVDDELSRMKRLKKTISRNRSRKLNLAKESSHHTEELS